MSFRSELAPNRKRSGVIQAGPSVSYPGIRTAAVWTIGAATLSTTVGQPSLGDLIFAGLQTQNWALVLAGCGAAAGLALTVDALLGVAEHTHASGRECLTAIVLAYEIYLGLCDAVRNGGFDPAGFGCIAVAAVAGRLLGLNLEQLSHAIANAAVPNVMLKQVRTDHLTPWKAHAAGYAGKAGVFAAQLARAGAVGPHLPFEGESGWCAHVAGQRFSLTLITA